MKAKISKGFTLNYLEWDSLNLGQETYELILDKDLNEENFDNLILNFKHNNLIFIKNESRNRKNSLLIAKHTNATLFDTNIKFLYKVKKETLKKSLLENNLEYFVSKELNLAFKEFIKFDESRFYKDTALNEKMKSDIYIQWVINSFNKIGKNFLTFYFEKKPVAFTLYTELAEEINIELISVKQDFQNKKLGSKMIELLKFFAYENNKKQIVVGTQVSNISALNFYIKNGFLVTKTTDIYHWWL